MSNAILLPWSEASGLFRVVLPELLFASTLILLAAGILCLALSRTTAALRCRVWSLSMVGLLCFPLISLFAPRLSPLFVPERGTVATESQTEPQAPALPETPAAMLAEIPTPEIQFDNLPNTSPGAMPNVVPDVTPVVQPVALADVSRESRTDMVPVMAAANVPEMRTPELAEETLKRNAGVSPWLAAGIVWCLGMLAALAGLVRSVIVSRNLFRHATLPDDPGWQREIDEISEKIGLRRTVLALICPTTAVPFVAGFGRQAVFLPPHCDDWDASQRRAVLVHELTHILRGDMRWQLLTRVATAFYWFQPLLWLAAWRIRTEREIACDDAVLRYGERPSQYAAVLLNVAASLKGRPRSTVGLGISMARRSRVERRIRAILQAGRNHMPLGRKTALLLFPLAALGVTVTAMLSPFEPPKFFADTHAATEDGNAVATENVDENAATQASDVQETPVFQLNPPLGEKDRDRMKDLYRERIRIAQENYDRVVQVREKTPDAVTNAEIDHLESIVIQSKIDLATHIVRESVGSPEEITAAHLNLRDHYYPRLIELAKANLERLEDVHKKTPLPEAQLLKARLRVAETELAALRAMAELDKAPATVPPAPVVRTAPPMPPEVYAVKKRALISQYEAAQSVHAKVYLYYLQGDVRGTAASEAESRDKVIRSQKELVRFLLENTSDGDLRRKLTDELRMLCREAIVSANDLVEAYEEAYDIGLASLDEVLAAKSSESEAFLQLVELFPGEGFANEDGTMRREKIDAVQPPMEMRADKAEAKSSDVRTFEPWLKNLETMTGAVGK